MEIVGGQGGYGLADVGLVWQQIGDEHADMASQATDKRWNARKVGHLIGD